MKKHIVIKNLEPPTVESYKYTFRHLEKFAKTHKGLTPIKFYRFLHKYSNERKLGLSAKSNLRKMVLHVIKLSLIKMRQIEYEAYFQQAVKLFKIRYITKTVMPSDVPTPEDIQTVKDNAHIMCALLVDFINTTCLRIAETVNIKLSQCRFNKVSNGYDIKFTRKGGYEYETWIPKELYDSIVIEYGSTTFLFQSPYYNDRPIHTCTAQRWLRKASTFTIRPVRPHLIRHKGINEVVKENPHIPLYILAELFGHLEKTLKGTYLNVPELDIPAINKKHYTILKESQRIPNNDQPTVHENTN